MELLIIIFIVVVIVSIFNASIPKVEGKEKCKIHKWSRANGELVCTNCWMVYGKD